MIKLEQDMDRDIHGVNNRNNFFLLSNYTLKSQIVIIDFIIAFSALIFLIIFNLYLTNNDKNIDKQKKITNERIINISEYLSSNAIKKIPTFDDSCNSPNRELSRLKCKKIKVTDKPLPKQLDITFTQQYIYSNFLNNNFIIKVYKEDLVKFADTDEDVYTDDEVLILDINLKEDEKIKKKIGIYENYEKIYFKYFHKIKKFFDQKRLNKSNLNTFDNYENVILEAIKITSSSQYIHKDRDNNKRYVFAKTITLKNIIYGVILIDNLISFDDYESASQSILLSNFFLFFITVLFLLSFLFLKSIVTPIKILSKNANLERDKSFVDKNSIIYPDRRDEIGILSNDIKSMSGDLRKRIKEIEEFSSDVSHELKNPLAGLKISNDLLKTKFLEEANRKLLITNMSLDIDRMNILISDISNYSQTQVEISKEVFEKIELNNFLKNFKNSLSDDYYLLELINLNSNIHLDINKDKFIQVLHNLLDNARSYILKNSKILIHTKIEDRLCIINFVDQGPGISMDYKYKIFERFYTDRSRNKNSHSGLGLSISKKIIENFGGSIKLIKSSHIGFEGACFEIKLPLREALSKNSI